MPGVKSVFHSSGQVLTRPRTVRMSMGHCNAPKAEGQLGPPPVRAAEEKSPRSAPWVRLALPFLGFSAGLYTQGKLVPESSHLGYISGIKKKKKEKWGNKEGTSWQIAGYRSLTHIDLFEEKWP